MYYIWESDFQYPAPFEVVIPDEWKEYDLYGGQSILPEHPMMPIQLLFDKEVELSDSIPSRHVFLFLSKKLINFISVYIEKDLIQCFPIDIVFNSSKKIVDNYFFVNITKTRKALDENKSEFSKSKYGELDSIQRLCIKENELNGDHVFRLDEYITLLLCSQVFKDNINNNGFTGIKFIPITQFGT